MWLLPAAFTRPSKNFKFSLASTRWFPYIIPCVAGLAQLVARHLAKVEVAGSNPVARSMHFRPVQIGLFHMAKWPSGKARACKALTPGSNPGFASRKRTGTRESGCPFSCVGFSRRRKAHFGAICNTGAPPAMICLRRARFDENCNNMGLPATSMTVAAYDARLRAGATHDADLLARGHELHQPRNGPLPRGLARDRHGIGE